MVETKKRLKVKVFITLADDLETLELKMNKWLDDTPEAEELKLVVPATIGRVAVLVVFYKV